MTNVDDTMNIRPPRAGTNQGSAQSNSVSGISGSSSAGKAGSAGASAGDTVSFTNTAAQMLKLEESLASIPDIDDTLVASIKASIAEGSYKIDPDKIVNRLLSIEKDFH